MAEERLHVRLLIHGRSEGITMIIFAKADGDGNLAVVGSIGTFYVVGGEMS